MGEHGLTTLYLTGSSTGIGRAIATAAVGRGNYFVHGFARGEGIDHPRYQHHTIDLADTAVLEAFQFPVPDQSDKLILMNNAGVLGEMDYLGSLNPSGLAAAFTVNLAAPAMLLNQFIRQFKTTACEKQVINISTGAAKNPYDGWSTYCASKAGVDMLTRVAVQEQELASLEHPFVIKAIAPGVVNTHMQETIRASEVEQFSRLEKFVSLYEENQLLRPEDCANAYLDAMENAFAEYETIDKIRL